MTAHLPDVASFARWWWPANWLRIVYAVCVDQRWYWQQIRPQLHGRNERLLLLQAALGATLCILLLALVLAATAGVLEKWQTGPDLLWTSSWLFVPFLGVLSGQYLGASWASRQVPDQQERVRLANPDRSLQTRDERSVR